MIRYLIILLTMSCSLCAMEQLEMPPNKKQRIEQISVQENKPPISAIESLYLKCCKVLADQIAHHNYFDRLDNTNKYELLNYLNQLDNVLRDLLIANHATLLAEIDKPYCEYSLPCELNAYFKKRDFFISPQGTFIICYINNKENPDVDKYAIFDTTNGHQRAILEEVDRTKSYCNYNITISPDDSSIAFLDRFSNQLFMFDATTGKQRFNLNFNQYISHIESQPEYVAYSPNGILFAVIHNHNIEIYNTVHGELVHLITNATFLDFSHKQLIFSHDNHYVVIGHTAPGHTLPDGYSIWNLRNNESTGVSFNNAEFMLHPTKNILIAYHHKTIYFYDFDNNCALIKTVTTNDNIHQITFNSAGNRYLITYKLEHTYKHELRYEEADTILTFLEENFLHKSIDSTLRFIAQDKKIIDLESSLTYPIVDNNYRDIHFSNNQSYTAQESRWKMIDLGHMKTGNHYAAIKTQENDAFIGFSPNAEYLFLRNEKHIDAWDLKQINWHHQTLTSLVALLMIDHQWLNNETVDSKLFDFLGSLKPFAERIYAQSNYLDTQQLYNATIHNEDAQQSLKQQLSGHIEKNVVLLCSKQSDGPLKGHIEGSLWDYRKKSDERLEELNYYQARKGYYALHKLLESGH